MANTSEACRNLYSFIRLRLGDAISDREIARRWRMEWKSFAGLKHGRRQVPRINELVELGRLLDVEAPFVFEVARGRPAKTVHRLLEQNDREGLFRLLTARALDVHRDGESKEARYASDREKRKFMRVPFEVPVRYTVGKRRGRAIAFNLGRGGIFLTTSDPPPLKTPVLLEWGLPRQRTPIQAKGVVVWHLNGAPAAPPGMGIQFSEIDGRCQRVVAKFVAEMVRHSGSRAGSARPSP
jgi:uncharacterized protein (TIGR02266 family)